MQRSGNIIFFFLLLMFGACDQQSTQELSLVNGRSITVDEFIFSYEMSPRSATSGPRETAYRQVLDRLIERVLLSQESQRRGLDQKAETIKELRFLEDAAIRRELFRDKIRKVTLVGEDDARLAFSMDQKTMWVKHVILDSLIIEKPATWNKDWLHVSINLSTETVETADFGKFDLVGWNDVESKLESILYQLELDEWSSPIHKNGQTHLFRLINVESNRMVTEGQFSERQEHYRSALRKRLEHNRSFVFVQETMQPQNLTIKRSVLEQLTQLLWASRSSQDHLSGSTGIEYNLKGLTIDDINSSVLAQFKSGEMTIEDFRFYYRMNPHKLDANSIGALRHELVNTIGIYVRDRVFAELGRHEGLQLREEVSKDYQYWEERLLASKLEQQIFELTENDNEGEGDKKLASLTLAELSANLRNQAEIKVDLDLLLKLKTSDEGLPRKIDFFATYLN